MSSVYRVYLYLFPREGFPTGKPTYSRLQKNTDVKGVYICLFWRAGFPRANPQSQSISPWAWKTRMRSGGGLWICLSPHRWQTAMWPHVGTLNSARSTFSSFDSTFTWAIASVLLSTSFIENSLGLALHESWGVACATTEKQWCPVSTESTSTCFRGKAFPTGKPT